MSVFGCFFAFCYNVFDVEKTYRIFPRRPFMADEKNKLKLLKAGLILCKFLIVAAIVLFVFGLIKMFLVGMDVAWKLYIPGWILLGIGLAGYIVFRVLMNKTAKKINFTPEEKKKRKIWRTVHLSLDTLGLVVLIVVACLVPSIGKKLLGESYFDLLSNGISSYARSVNNSSADQIKTRQGFMKGVCHVDTDQKADWALGANINWDRLDVSMVTGYDSLTKTVIPGAGYLSQKANWQALKNRGLTIMGVTPYPDDYTDLGYSVTDGTGDEAIEAIAKFYLEDLKDIVKCWQISNELQLVNFAKNLTFDQASRFQGIQLKAMYERREELGLKNDILLGYNLAGGDIISYNQAIKTWREQYCDYVGLDLYLGCFENMMHSTWCNEMFLRSVYNSTHLPVIEAEFGYMGGGKAKTQEEKNKLLKDLYGYNNETEARADVMNLIYLPQFPTDLRNRIPTFAHVDSLAELDQSKAETALFDTELANHLYKVIQSGYYLSEYPHTPEGQGQFFRDIIPSIRSLPFVIGAFCYDIVDSDSCYVCGQTDCPVETSWGLVDSSGNYKPSWYAVKQAFAS